jgi:hypothetical protein
VNRWSSSCVCLIALACAHAPQKSAVAALHPPDAAPPAAANASFELPSIGLSIRAPGPMALFDFEQNVGDGPIRGVGAGCTVGSQEYFAARYFRAGRDRMKDDAMLKNARKTLKTVSREAPVVLGELSGVELEGVTEHGSNALLRNYVTGDGFWIVQVTAAKGAVDRPRALAFLDSFAPTQPWSVHAFPEAHFSVLFPDGGVRVDKKAMHAETVDFAEGAWLGGITGRTFIVWATPLQGASATPDERMDLGINGLVGSGNRILWQSPVAVDDARARDVLMQNGAIWTRLRIVVTDTRFYMLQASANAKSPLLDDSVTRFLGSFREYPQ